MLLGSGVDSGFPLARVRDAVAPSGRGLGPRMDHAADLPKTEMLALPASAPPMARPMDQVRAKLPNRETVRAQLAVLLPHTLAVLTTSERVARTVLRQCSAPGSENLHASQK